MNVPEAVRLRENTYLISLTVPRDTAVCSSEANIGSTLSGLTVTLVTPTLTFTVHACVRGALDVDLLAGASLQRRILCGDWHDLHCLAAMHAAR